MRRDKRELPVAIRSHHIASPVSSTLEEGFLIRYRSGPFFSFFYDTRHGSFILSFIYLLSFFASSFSVPSLIFFACFFLRLFFYFLSVTVNDADEVVARAVDKKIHAKSF